jgi:Ca2+-binding RTX toxin-like protein
VSDLAIDLNPRPGPEVSDDTNGNNTVEWAEPGMVNTVIGGCGDDTITGDARPNIMSGEDGLDTVNGGGGDDLLYNGDEWSPDGDTLDGDEGDDSVRGYGHVTLRGGDGKDEILANSTHGEPGLVTNVQGGAGDDTIKAEDDQPDTIDCGDGNDTVFFDEGIDTVTNCEIQNLG